MLWGISSQLSRSYPELLLLTGALRGFFWGAPWKLLERSERPILRCLEPIGRLRGKGAEGEGHECLEGHEVQAVCGFFGVTDVMSF